MIENFGYKKTDKDVEYHEYENGIEIKRIHKIKGKNGDIYILLFKLLFENKILKLQVTTLNQNNILVEYLELGNFNLFDGQIVYKDKKIIYNKNTKDKTHKNVNDFIDEAEETYYKKLRKEKVKYFYKRKIKNNFKKYFLKPLFNFLADYPKLKKAENNKPGRFNYYTYEYTNYKNLKLFIGTVTLIVASLLLFIYILNIRFKLNYGNLVHLLGIILIVILSHYLSIQVKKKHAKLFKNKYE